MATSRPASGAAKTRITGASSKLAGAASKAAGAASKAAGAPSKPRDADASDAPDSGPPSLVSQLGLDRLAGELQGLGMAMADHGVDVVTDRLDNFAQKLGGSKAPVKAIKHIAEGDSKSTAVLKAGVESVKDTGAKGVSSVMTKLGDAVSSSGSKDKGKKDKKLKVTNIVEELDLPVPRQVAYDAWTQFTEFPGFMKKVEKVDQKEDETLEWTAQIFWSHRSWTANIVDQVPNERIVWHSKGEKGHVDGAVTFHELTPDLTRMLVNLEFHPHGFFEHTGNLWRAPGRRVRLELKHFRRHLTNQVLLHQEDVEGWRGEIHEGEVTKKSPESEDQVSESPKPEDQAPESPESEDQASEPAPSQVSSGNGAAEAKPRSPAAKKSPSSRPRPAAKKSTVGEPSPSRPRTTAKKPPSGSTPSSRGSRPAKSTNESSSARSKS